MDNFLEDLTLEPIVLSLPLGEKEIQLAWKWLDEAAKMQQGMQPPLPPVLEPLNQQDWITLAELLTNQLRLAQNQTLH